MENNEKTMEERFDLEPLDLNLPDKKIKKLKSFIRTEIEKAKEQAEEHVSLWYCQKIREEAKKEGFEEGKEIGNDDFNSLKEEIKQTQLKEIRKLIENWKDSDLVDPKGVWINKSDLLKELE